MEPPRAAWRGHLRAPRHVRTVARFQRPVSVSRRASRGRWIRADRGCRGRPSPASTPRCQGLESRPSATRSRQIKTASHRGRTAPGRCQPGPSCVPLPVPLLRRLTASQGGPRGQNRLNREFRVTLRGPPQHYKSVFDTRRLHHQSVVNRAVSECGDGSQLSPKRRIDLDLDPHAARVPPRSKQSGTCHSGPSDRSELASGCRAAGSQGRDCRGSATGRRNTGGQLP